MDGVSNASRVFYFTACCLLYCWLCETDIAILAFKPEHYSVNGVSQLVKLGTYVIASCAVDSVASASLEQHPH